MFHSATICGKNTWSDYHMVPADGLIMFPSPSQKLTSIDVKTGNGVVDMSEVLTGFPVFQNREDEIKFYVLEDWEYADYSGTTPVSMTAYELKSKLMNEIHGKTGRIILEDDPNWYFEGRFFVKDFNPENFRREVTIGYSVKPYMFSNTPTNVTVEGMGSEIWSMTTLDETTLGHMPVTPVINFSGLASATTVKIRVFKPSYTDPTDIWANPILVAEKEYSANGDKQWADVNAYKKSRFCLLAPVGVTTVWKFTKGRL